MTATIESIAALISKWGEELEMAEALFLTGSNARDTSFLGGDLDVACVMGGNSAGAALVESLTAYFAQAGAAVEFLAPNRQADHYVLWLGEGLVKVDLALLNSDEELWKIAQCDPLDAPRLHLLWAKEPHRHDAPLSASAARSERQSQDPPLSLIREEIDRFMVAFEDASRGHARSDAFDHYRAFNIALDSLIALTLHCRRPHSGLYGKKGVLANVFSLEEQKQVRNLAATLYLPEAAEKKRILVGMFSSILAELEQKTGHDLGRSRYLALLERVMARDLLLNFRDLSLHSGGHLIPGRLYRSSTLSRYSGSPELQAHLESTRIGRIIDLRMDYEVEAKPYSEADLVGITHSRHPINIPPGGHPDGYFGQLMTNAGSVVTAMEFIADATSPVLIHCHVGKDRTGWMCALLGMLAGVPDRQIVHDYLASHSDVVRERIQGFIHSVREAGGASVLLCRLGSTPDTLNRVVNRIAMRDMHSPEEAHQ